MKNYRYKLVVSAGSYEADTLWELLIEVLRHRFYHLRHHGRWMD